MEKTFAAAYPNNSHIRPKVRQQLQVLEALGYLERTAKGEYRVLL
jgi:DNA-binding IclR family transcriptional regulator